MKWNILEIELVCENKIDNKISVARIDNRKYWRLYTY